MRERLRNTIKVLLTLAVTIYLTNIVVESFFMISDGLGIACIVGIILIGAWICAE
jgi:hypothetical protein